MTPMFSSFMVGAGHRSVRSLRCGRLSHWQELIRLYIPQRLMLAARPTYFVSIQHFELSRTEVHTEIAGGCVPDARSHVIGLIAYPDHRTDAIAIAFRSDQLEDQPRVGSSADIFPELGTIAQRRCHYV